MAASIYQNEKVQQELNKMVGFTPKLGEIRYLVAQQGDFSKGTALYHTFLGLVSQVRCYVRDKLEDGSHINVDTLSNISILRIAYEKDQSAGVHMLVHLEDELYANITEHSLTELLFKESQIDSNATLIDALLDQVEGLKQDYNEYIYFLQRT